MRQMKNIEMDERYLPEAEALEVLYLRRRILHLRYKRTLHLDDVLSRKSLIKLLERLESQDGVCS